MEPDTSPTANGAKLDGAKGKGTSPVNRLGGDFGVRLLSSAILIPVALLTAWWGGLPAYVLAGLIGSLVFAEWALVVGRSTSLVPRSPDVVIGLLLVFAAALVTGLAGSGLGLAVILAALAAVGLLSRSGWLAAGIVYAGLFGVAVTALRSDAAFGLQAVVILLVLVWATDSAAYVIGRTVGGPKLWPRVSPKKTWSGSVGGLVAGVVVAALAAFLIHVPVGAVLIVLLVLLSAVSQAGDLVESAIKRRFGKKDASHIIPGHGGMMDRIDGLIFAATMAAAIGWLHAGERQIGVGLLLW